MDVCINGDQWRRALRLFPDHDFYHTYDYHVLGTAGDESLPHLFCYQGRQCSIALPLLIRRGHIDGRDFYDATSVYGYPGPLISGSAPSEIDICNFQKEIRQELKALGVISAFSRLHPIRTNADVLKGLGATKEKGGTISIDLNSSPEEQWRRYRSNHKRDIAKLKNRGVTCQLSACGNDLDHFIALYDDTMLRLGATETYRFSSHYFEQLMAARDFDMHLFVCRAEAKVICGGLFSSCNGVIQYHLGATERDYLRLAPTKLLFDTVRLWGLSRGFQTFHLGGGMGSALDDLYHFKRGFSDISHAFSVWEWVADQEIYNELCDLRNKELLQSGRRVADTGFFPRYRAPSSEAEEGGRRIAGR